MKTTLLYCYRGAFWYGESHSKSEALNVSPKTYLIPCWEFCCWELLTESAVKTPSGEESCGKEKKVCERGQIRSHVRDLGVCGEQLEPFVHDRFIRDRESAETDAKHQRLATSGSNSFKAFNTRLNSRSYYTGVIIRAIYGTPRRSHAIGERSGELGKSGTNVLVYPDVCTHIHVRACLYMIHINMYISRRFIAAETEELRTWLFDPRKYYPGLSSVQDMFFFLSLTSFVCLISASIASFSFSSLSFAHPSCLSFVTF